MVRIAIVDDEEKIRLGLARLIERIGEAFRVTGVFAGGTEFMDALERLEADLAIVDVKMPVLDGLELIERARAVRPDLYFAVLSGFDEFEYARRALRNGVLDYLLKPVGEKELRDLLVRVGELVSRSRQRRLSALEDSLALAVGSDREAVPTHLRERALATLDRSGLFDGCAVLMLLQTHPAVSKDVLESRLKREGNELAVASLAENMIAAVIRIGDNESSFDRLCAAMEEWMEQTAADDVRVGVSSAFSGTAQFPAACRGAETALQHAWYAPQRRALYKEMAARPLEKNDAVQLFFLLEREFWPSVEILDVSRAIQALRAWTSEIGQQRIPWKTLSAGFETIYAMLGGKTAGANDEPVWDPRRYPGWFAYAEHFLARAQEVLHKRRDKRQESRVVEKIKSFIHRHYQTEIKLSRLAEEVFLSPSYLSKLFHAETGQTITDYLISYRIERAKALLLENNGLKTYEIGEKVGYPDPAYFNKIFKKIVGLTPKEYRERVR